MGETEKILALKLGHLYNEGVKIFNIEKENQKATSVRAPKDPKNTIVTGYHRINTEYQSWYTKALPVVKQLLPDRFQEFQDQYRFEKRPVKGIDFTTYTIYDYLMGIHVKRGGVDVIDRYSSFSTRFSHQLDIFRSTLDRLSSRLTDIEGILQSELFDHELEAADDLLKKNHLRAAGALAGVSLEIHLNHVCANHGIKISKKSPTISDFTEKLKAEGVFDIPTWRHILHLGDIRNLCVHNKDREPTFDEVSDLLIGTKKFIATTF